MDCERLGKRYNKGEDILSRLPDDVLSHIFSCLEAKDAVKTSVLSSRFKDVWTLIYNLRFDVPKRTFGVGYCGTSFVNFVEFVLRRCQSNIIQNFHLSTYNDLLESDAACLIELISFVVGRNVRSLKLKFDVIAYRPMIRLPQSILTCKSLVRLSLSFFDFVLDIPDCMVCFPCLKFLSIFVTFPNSNLMQKLFRSCPTLEELKIKGFVIMSEDALTFDINMPTLKKLKIYFRGYFRGHIDDGIPYHKFVVRARNLEYLIVCNDFLTCFVRGETPFLNKVILDTEISKRFSRRPPNDEETKHGAELFRAISSTRFLSLDNILFSELYHLRYGTLPSFPNLIHLYLGCDFPFGFAWVVQLLINSPNLEVLVLNKEYVYYKDEVMSELECVPSCMLLHLKEIYLFSVDWDDQDLEVIKWLLENSKVLERFSFHTSEIIKDEQEMQNEILNWPRASPICKIEFVLYYNYTMSEFHKCRKSFYSAAFRL